MSSHAIWIQAKIGGKRYVAYNFQVNTELRTDIRGERFTVHEFSYPEEFVMLRSDMRCSTVFKKKLDIYSSTDTLCSFNNSGSDPCFLKQRPLLLKDFVRMKQLKQPANLAELFIQFYLPILLYLQFTFHCNETNALWKEHSAKEIVQVKGLTSLWLILTTQRICPRLTESETQLFLFTCK